MRALSIPKFEPDIINEDAAKATPHYIAISDGAGGGGVFADRWSAYLIAHVPNEPIANFQTFDQWIDGIWEPFYNQCEEIAQKEGGMLLNKFYDEGSFATIVIVWKNGQWISYGDSVAFCYDKEQHQLQHSFGRIATFNNPPYLVNCKDPLNSNGFRTGQFNLTPNSILFATSDTLGQYILMMYEVAHKEQYQAELQEAIEAKTKQSNFIKTALSMNNVEFEKDVLYKLLNCKNNTGLTWHLQTCREKGLIGHDDYSIATF